MVFRDFTKNNYGYIEVSLKRLRDCATLASLEILEVLNWNLYARTQVEKIESHFIDLSVARDDNLKDVRALTKQLTINVNIKLVNLLKETIASIKERDSNYGPLAFIWSSL